MRFYGNQEDNLPLDETEEERIKEAQTKMGDRTAFFYGKSSFFYHVSSLADMHVFNRHSHGQGSPLQRHLRHL